MNQSSNALRDIIRVAREKAAGTEAAPAATEAAAKPAEPAAAPAAEVVTETPAAETKGAAKFQVYKADADTGVIYTFASAANIVDKDGDKIEPADLISMAHGFCVSKGSFNANHGQNHYDLSKAELVESIVGAPILKSGRTMKAGEELPPADEDPVIGMNIEKGNETHWLIGVKPNDDAVLEIAKAGGIVGASMEAFANKVEVK